MKFSRAVNSPTQTLLPEQQQNLCQLVGVFVAARPAVKHAKLGHNKRALLLSLTKFANKRPHFERAPAQSSYFCPNSEPASHSIAVYSLLYVGRIVQQHLGLAGFAGGRR